MTALWGYNFVILKKFVKKVLILKKKKRYTVFFLVKYFEEMLFPYEKID